jgi:hypothetical protein
MNNEPNQVILRFLIILDPGTCICVFEVIAAFTPNAEQRLEDEYLTIGVGQRVILQVAASAATVGWAKGKLVETGAVGWYPPHYALRDTDLWYTKSVR